MANHKSALKRIRQDAARRLHNRYYHKSTRNAIRKLQGTTDAKEAQELLSSVTAMIDKLAKRNIIHQNKAANLKSGVSNHVNSLTA